MGDSTEDDGKEGVYPVNGHDLGSVSEETFNPGIDFTTDTISPNLLKEEPVIYLIEGLSEVQIDGVSVMAIEEIAEDLVNVMEKLG